VSQAFNKKVSKSNFKAVLHRRALGQHTTVLAPASAPSRLVDWGTAADVPLFLGAINLSPLSEGFNQYQSFS
jgi:hypothetical protein